MDGTCHFHLIQVQMGTKLEHLAGAIWVLTQEGSWPQILLMSLGTELEDLLLTPV